MIILGIFLEVLAAALGTLSKQLIAYSEHVKKRWIFHIGASINIFVGPVVDASAYAFAPQVVIAPFACLDVIFNALTAPYTLHWQNEQFTNAHLFGTGLVAMGAVFTSVFGSVTDVVLSVEELEAQLMEPASIIYMVVELSLILSMSFLLKAKLVESTIRGIALGVIAGILMGNVFFLKGFMNIVHDTFAKGDGRAWLRPTPYICIAAAASGAVLGHIFMRKGLGEYKGVFMVTIFEGAHITAACLSGCIVMEEMAHAPWWQYSVYWMSVGTIISGMLLINTTAKDSELKNNKQFHIAGAFSDQEPRGHQIGRPVTETYPQPEKDSGLEIPEPPISETTDMGTMGKTSSEVDLELNCMLDDANIFEDGMFEYPMKTESKIAFKEGIRGLRKQRNARTPTNKSDRVPFK